MTRNLRLIRESKGLSREALSRETGVNMSTIWKYETGRSEMLKPLLKRIAKYLSTSIEELAIEIVENNIKNINVKSCLNQRCPLNKQCYCKSDQVCNGAECRNQNEVSNKAKDINFNNTKSLFI